MPNVKDACNEPRYAIGFPARAARMLLPILLIAGCSPKVLSWTEEVQLESKELLVVRRTISFKEYQPWSGGGGGSDILDSTLEVVTPKRSDNPARWSHPPLIPMVLDQDADSHEWIVVATFYMCTAWYDLGRPELPYAEFRYRGGQWMQEPLSERLIGREGNLLVPNQADVDRDHTLASKRGVMGNPTISPRHRRVISNWKTNC
jgi:hypothetical protein